VAQLHRYIARGWLPARRRPRRRGARPITYVSIDALHALLRQHPDIYDYLGSPERTRAVLQLDALPAPPRWKRVVCRSDAWQPAVRQVPAHMALAHGAPAPSELLPRLRQRCCAAIGGTPFWSRLYSLPMCPRCGCQVSRYSPDGVFTNVDPAADEVIAIQAGKQGRRCEGRGALASTTIGAIAGEDRKRRTDGGTVCRIPVKVLLVEDVEHRHEVVGALLRAHDSVIVFCESIADGEELQDRYGIPFIGGAKDGRPLRRGAKSLIVSRIGDAGTSGPPCQVTVDHSGFVSSRMQDFMRLTGLMHPDRALFHCILMTHEERHRRFAALVEALRAKGIAVEEATAERQKPVAHRLLSPTLQARVSAQENRFLSLLGWRRDELNRMV
jgi:hypothetical protein